MEYKSYFKGNLAKENPNITIYPLETIPLLKLLDNKILGNLDLYIEKGLTTIEKPCEVFTESDFDEKLQSKKLQDFLEKDDELFVMNAVFEIQNPKTRFEIDDDIETTIISSSKDYLLSLLVNVFENFAFSSYHKIIELIESNLNQIICLNEDGTLLKIFNNKNELLNDSETLKYY